MLRAGDVGGVERGAVAHVEAQHVVAQQQLGGLADIDALERDTRSHGKAPDSLRVRPG